MIVPFSQAFASKSKKKARGGNSQKGWQFKYLSDSHKFTKHSENMFG